MGVAQTVLSKTRRFQKLFAIGAGLALASASPASAVLFVEGDVFASIGSGLVQHYNAAGVLLETLDTTNGGFTTGSAFDASGNLYVTNFSANRVAVFDNTGVLVNADFVSGLSTPESVVFDQAGNLYVGNLGNGIRKYTSAGAFVGTVINTRVDFFDLTADQSTFRYGQEGNVILTVSNATPGTPGPNFASGLTQAFAMRVLSDGGLLVADNVNIKRFDAGGNLVQSYDVATVDGWFALNLDPDGESFWSGSFNDGILRKFDIDDGSVSQTIATGCGSSCLFGVAVFGEITAGGPGTPAPEPATLALLGMGILALRFVRRRRSA